MGDRAIITVPLKENEDNRVGIYVHWEGKREYVEHVLCYCYAKGYRSPETDGYGLARMCQVFANFIGGDLGIGLVLVGDDNEPDYCDNGTYVVGNNWQIIKRLNWKEDKLPEMDLFLLERINFKMPVAERLTETELKEALNKYSAKRRKLEEL